MKPRLFTATLFWPPRPTRWFPRSGSICNARVTHHHSTRAMSCTSANVKHASTRKSGRHTGMASWYYMFPCQGNTWNAIATIDRPLKPSATLSLLRCAPTQGMEPADQDCTHQCALHHFTSPQSDFRVQYDSFVLYQYIWSFFGN